MGRARTREGWVQRIVVVARRLFGGSFGNHRPTVSGAFTLVELLVVIAIIAVLLAIMMPALGRVREQARRMKCAASIRQHVFGLHTYGNENDGQLPIYSSPAAADIECTTVNFMLRSGLTREEFFCPSNATHRKYNDHLWILGYPDSNPGGWDGTFFTTPETTRILSDYSWLFLNKPKAYRFEITPYVTDTIKKTWVRTLQDRRPSAKELVADRIEGTDASVKTVASTMSEQYGWSFIKGLVPADIAQQNANHLQGLDPAGSNIGFLDGHSEWRRFNPDVDETGIAIPRCRLATSSPCAWFW